MWKLLPIRSSPIKLPQRIKGITVVDRKVEARIAAGRSVVLLFPNLNTLRSATGYQSDNSRRPSAQTSAAPYVGNDAAEGAQRRGSVRKAMVLRTAISSPAP